MSWKVRVRMERLFSPKKKVSMIFSEQRIVV
jgi:hypothetical protein